MECHICLFDIKKLLPTNQRSLLHQCGEAQCVNHLKRIEGGFLVPTLVLLGSSPQHSSCWYSAFVQGRAPLTTQPDSCPGGVRVLRSDLGGMPLELDPLPGGGRGRAPGAGTHGPMSLNPPRRGKEGLPSGAERDSAVNLTPPCGGGTNWRG